MSALNETYEMRIICTAGVQTSVNVRNYVITTHNGTGATTLQMAIGLDTLIAAAFKNLMSLNSVYRGVGVRKVLPLPIGLETSTIASLNIGSQPSDLLPRQVSGVLSLRTNFGGRRYRGRMYIPFPAESDSDADGTPTAGYVTRLIALSALLVAPFTVGGGGNTDTLTPVVRSKTGGFTTAIASIISRGTWGTIRSRGGFGRPNSAPF